VQLLILMQYVEQAQELVLEASSCLCCLQDLCLVEPRVDLCLRLYLLELGRVLMELQALELVSEQALEQGRVLMELQALELV
jgi:hypothetical protein